MSADPPFTDEHEELRDSIRRFVAAELRPHAAAWEEARWFPDEVFAKLAMSALRQVIKAGGDAAPDLKFTVKRVIENRGDGEETDESGGADEF